MNLKLFRLLSEEKHVHVRSIPNYNRPANTSLPPSPLPSLFTGGNEEKKVIQILTNTQKAKEEKGYQKRY